MRFRHTVTRLDHSDPRKGGALTPRHVAGCNARVLLVFAGSPITCLEGDGTTVGSAAVHQTEEPVLYRYADMTYSHLKEVPVRRTIVHELYTRPGQVSTVVTVPFTVPEVNASHAIRAAVQRGERALAYVVLTLDERVADRRQGELVVVETTDGELLADVTYAVRTFDGAAETIFPTAGVLAGLRDLDLSPESGVAGPLSLYLHAVEKRYSAEGFVLLAAAADALADAGSFNPQRIREALSMAGATGL